MYTPQPFKTEDSDLIRQFIAENSFAILVSAASGTEIHDTHLPLVMSDDGTHLHGHIAKANEHWKAWEQTDQVKVIFHGPHAYVSPTFYASEFNVPTWNYTTVSISGEIEIITEFAEQKASLHALVNHHEAGMQRPWSFDDSNEKLTRLFAALVFFKIRIQKTEAKFKLNQNKSSEDQAAVIDQLSKSKSTFDQEVARMMTENLNKKGD